MNQLFDHITMKACLAGCCSAASWLFGGFDAALLALSILYLSDFALGFFRALQKGTYCSEKFRHGVGKFIAYSVAIIMANMLDVTMGESLPAVFAYIREFLVMYLASNEFLSVAVHLAEMELGVIPRQLTDRIKSFRDEFDPIQNRSRYGTSGYGTSSQHGGNSLLGFNLGGRGSDRPVAQGEGLEGDRVSRGVPERPPHKPRRL
ncbi:phage holin family protein [Maridesulfovibrio ferrireducens]|uniref:phage holin family protein n=1 Tax=Maridesulfovibrio ferrireducens TaxID=246191 RepID=UPI001A275144|nr:phage holin family protein [Maridesulfovibrio ferrireducens]MBI9109996.1 phage holin family protein [Maridesulfovibrio ferrireducens]